MLTFFNAISKRVVLIILLILVITVTFETAQQLFYLKRFNLNSEATFLSILKTQTVRWLIWTALSSILIWFVKKNSANTFSSLSGFTKYSFAIIGLVFMNILIISIIQININGDIISFTNLTTDYMVFFMFQKAPMYTLGYIAITMILHLYFANELLQIKVQTLEDLKILNENLYNKLSSTIDDKTTILNIKVGNKRKIIPVKDINWIEADDYCVKVHTTKSNTYTMRSSLKALEQKLDSNFLRVHRKAIVNMSLVKEMNLSQTPILILQNDQEVSISKSNLKLVKDFIS